MGMPTTVDNVQTIGLWEINRLTMQESKETRQALGDYMSD